MKKNFPGNAPLFFLSGKQTWEAAASTEIFPDAMDTTGLGTGKASSNQLLPCHLYVTKASTTQSYKQ